MKLAKIFENAVKKTMKEVDESLYYSIIMHHRHDRLTMTNRESLKGVPSQQMRKYKMEIGPKPNGLWYGIGTSWIDWVRSEMPGMERDYVYLLEVDESKMKIIKNYEELVEFENEYREYNLPGTKLAYIDWRRVSEKYGGIEIAPYIWKARNTHFWYYGWDVASGCIWEDSVIKYSKKLYSEL